MAERGRRQRGQDPADTRRSQVRHWSLGGTSAEADPLLEQAFVDNGVYSRLVTGDDPQWFLVGRTGSGKSAALRQLELDQPNKVTRIDPRELAFQHITNLQAIQRLLTMNVRLEPFFHALWRHLLLCQVVRHRYTNPTEDTKRRLFERLRDWARKRPATSRSVECVEELERDFWDTMEVQVRRQVDRFVSRVDEAFQAGGDVSVMNVSGRTASSDEQFREDQAEWRDRFQRMVNDDAVLRLNSVVRELAEQALESEQHYTYIIVDDLDLVQVENDVANLLIKCLLQVALELQRTRYMKVVVALRTNIFDQLKVGEQARGGQEEKLRGAAITLKWSRTELEEVINRRLAAEAKRRNVAKTPTVDTILPAAAQDRISAWSYIVNRTLMRPRDVILYFNHCLEDCVANTPKITWKTIKDVEHRYSRDRLSALRDEWNDPFFDIERLFECFRARPWSFGVEVLGSVCQDIALLLVEAEESSRRVAGGRAFRGAPWLTPLCEPLWQSGSSQRPWRDLYGPLLSVLFDIGFIGCAPHARQEPVYGTDPTADLRDLLRGMRDDAEFSVHSAFRSALEMTSPGRSTS